ncbi:hypothetical protein F4560_002813 [Saccharothrix ecbatanensis]|uniref:Uncharacterized protein n=1 Tax=Saccharothrix ecbatanensis TaxID=1105145 RepID=A0A7W9HJ24_9PSEU|nr:hypothetical protein [Saccharothrix ecbatanensis]
MTRRSARTTQTSFTYAMWQTKVPSRIASVSALSYDTLPAE